MNRKTSIYCITLAVLILLLITASLVFGSVHIPAEAVADILCGNEVEKASWRFIVLESRIPQCITAALCGAALSASGLMLQTAFNNPLADASILGISSGSSLGVALVMLAGGGTLTAGSFSLSGFMSVILGAFLVYGLPEIFRDFAQARMLIFGLALMIMMIIRPQGILPPAPRRYDVRAILASLRSGRETARNGQAAEASAEGESS